MKSHKIKVKSKQDIENFKQNKGKSIVTSFSLPVWNKRRLFSVSKKLKQKGFNISTQDIMLQALQLIMTKLKRQDEQPLLNRAVQYNNATSTYESMSIRMNPVQYNSFHSKKMIMKVSLSYLLDLALRLYLRLIMNLFLKKKKKIRGNISYYKKAIKFTFNKIFFIEKVNFYIKI